MSTPLASAPSPGPALAFSQTLIVALQINLRLSLVISRLWIFIATVAYVKLYSIYLLVVVDFKSSLFKCQSKQLMVIYKWVKIIKKNLNNNFLYL